MNKQKLYIKTIPFIFNILLHIMVLSIDRFTLLASFLHLWEETPGKPPLLVGLEKKSSSSRKRYYIVVLCCLARAISYPQVWEKRQRLVKEGPYFFPDP